MSTIIGLKEWKYIFKTWQRYTETHWWRILRSILTPITDENYIRLCGGITISRTTVNDISTIENDEISFHEVSCGVLPNTYDLIINCRYVTDMWVIIKSMFVPKHRHDKKITTTLNDFIVFKTLAGESLHGSFKRFNVHYKKIAL